MDIYFNHTIRTEAQAHGRDARLSIQNEIEREKFYANSLEAKLLMIASSTPREMKDDEGTEMDWIDWCGFHVPQTLEELMDNRMKILNLELALDYVDEIQADWDREFNAYKDSIKN